MLSHRLRRLLPRVAISIVMMATFVVGTGARTAPAAASLTLEATYTSVANGWVRVERWLDNNAGFTQEQYPPDGRGDQDGACTRSFRC